jgi:co-chaperonin GroES (HSP10)
MGKVLRPLGARIIVKDIVSSLSDTEKWKRAGLELVTEESNRPRNTTGKIVALGTDPLLRDAGLKEGLTVFFAPHAGTYIIVEDEEFRSLDFSEIISTLDETT